MAFDYIPSHGSKLSLDANLVGSPIPQVNYLFLIAQGLLIESDVSRLNVTYLGIFQLSMLIRHSMLALASWLGERYSGYCTGNPLPLFPTPHASTFKLIALPLRPACFIILLENPTDSFSWLAMHDVSCLCHILAPPDYRPIRTRLKLSGFCHKRT